MKERRLFIDGFSLKIIALVTMSLSHIGFMMVTQGYFADASAPYNTGVIFQYIGRLAFPIFAFLLAEGLRKTHDRLNYLLRLSLMCLGILLVQTIIYLIDSNSAATMGGNAFLDLCLGASFIYLLEHPKKFLRPLAILPFGYVVLSYAMDVSELYAASNNAISAWSVGYPLYLRSAYSLFGFLMIVAFYYAPCLSCLILKALAGGNKIDDESLISEQKIQGFNNAVAAVVLVSLNLIFWAMAKSSLPDPYSMGAESYSALAAILILFYNGRRGYDAKWWRIFTYAYYPAHLILIWSLFALCFR